MPMIFIFPECAEGLQRLLNRISAEEDIVGLKIYTLKTNMVVVNRNPNQEVPINVNRMEISKVLKFKYLGSWISENLNPDLEMGDQIEMARAKFLKMRRLLATGHFTFKQDTTSLSATYIPYLCTGMRLGR